MSIPTIDISPYLNGSDKEGVAAEINKACEEIGEQAKVKMHCLLFFVLLDRSMGIIIIPRYNL